MALCMVGTVACSDEDALVPSNTREDYFTILDSQTDEVSLLRKQFKTDTGVHLLFNDTLYVEKTGTDAFGDDILDVKRVDFRYELTNVSTSSWRFYYLQNYADMRECTDFVRRYILPHFGSSLLPYSLLLVNSIEYDEYGYEDWEEVAMANNWQCMALGVGGALGLDDDEKAAYADSFLQDMLSGMFDIFDERLDPFYNVVYDGADCYSDYFSDYFTDFDPDSWTKEDNIADIYELGFLTCSYSWWYGDWYFPSARNDFNSYYSALFSMTQEEFEQKYAAYPLVMKKYNILKNFIIDLGYKF